MLRSRQQSTVFKTKGRKTSAGPLWRVYTAQLEALLHQPANKQEGRDAWTGATLSDPRGCWCESRHTNKWAIHNSGHVIQ